ncbi:hypothetical protein [Jejubacter calystegiae]|nr:hypothetical protein [Jejubacter calystegiae]
MSKKQMTDLLIKDHGITWEQAYQYLVTAEWVYWLAAAYVREDITTGTI